MRAAWRLGACFLLMRLRQARRGEPDSSFFAVLVVLALGVFALGLWLFTVLFRAVIEAEGAEAAEAMVLFACAGAGLFQMVAGFRWAVEKLFLASDLELLLSAPVPHSTLVASKVVETAAASPISVLVVTATLHGYAAATGRAYGLALAVAAAAALALVAAMPGLVVSMILARFVSPSRLQAAVALMPMLVSVPAALAAPMFASFFAPGQGPIGTGTVPAALRLFPSSWPAEAALRAVEGRWREAGTRALAVLVVGAGALVLTYVVFRSTFYVSWGRINEGAGRRVGAPMLERYLDFLPSPVRAIVLKDWRSLRRDVRALIQLFFPLLFLAVMFSSTFRGAGQVPRPTFMLWAPLMFAGSTLQSFAFESRNIALVRLAPVRGAEVLAGKFAAQLLPALLLVWVAILGLTAFGASPPLVSLRLFLLATWLLAGAVFINLSIGALFTDFGAAKPRVDIGPSIGAMIATVLFTGATVALAGWPAPGVPGMAVPPAVRVLAAATLAALACGSLVLARQAIARLDSLDPP